MTSVSLNLIKMALAEDIGSGDITSLYFISEEKRSKARIITRKQAVIAGIETVFAIFSQLDPQVKVIPLTQDGDQVEAGATILELEGKTRSLLAGERVALNFLGRLIGIATLTSQYVQEVAGTGVTILDTRKMTPAWRELEKEAVKAGGGANHRVGLFDAILAKDNHLAALGTDGIKAVPVVIKKIRQEHPQMKIEIEADHLAQVEIFLNIPELNTILLDNMSLKEMREAVSMKNRIAPSVHLEASGGITLENLRAVAETGIDEISLGALTHSASWGDLSLEFVSDL